MYRTSKVTITHCLTSMNNTIRRYGLSPRRKEKPTEALHPWCLGVCWVETSGKQKSIGGPWTNLSKSSSHPKVYECRICILLEVYPSPKLPCFIWESLVSPSWQNKDQLYCHCSSLSLLEVGESSSPKWQNRKNHPLDLDDYTVHHPMWSRSKSLSLQVPSMSFHPLLTWCFGSGCFRNPGSSIGDLWRYSKFMPKHQAPNHFSTYAMARQRLPTGLVSATQQRGGFTQSPSNQLQNKFHHAFVLLWKQRWNGL